MAPATRRTIWWVAGAFVIYELIRLAVALIAGSVAWANASSLAREGLNQTATVAASRLESLGSSAGVANGALQDPLYWGLEGLPHIGEDLKFASGALDAVGRGGPVAADLLRSLPPKKKLSQLDLSSFAAKDVGTAVQTMTGIAKASLPKFEALDPSGLDFGLGPKLQIALPALRDLAQGGPELTQLATAAASVGESGALKPAYWFLANQNLAEARGTGGLIGSYAVVKVYRGHITLDSAGSDQQLNAMGPVDHSSLPLDTGIIWQDDPKIWQDINPSAHVPYAAQQISDTWLKYRHQRIDGVIFMGQGIAQDLVAAFGPVSFAGNTLDSTTTAEFLAKGIYAKYPDVNTKNLMVQKFMTALMLAAKAQKPDLLGLVHEVASSKTGDRIAVWSADEKQQARNESMGIAGAVSAEYNQDVTVAVNNGGGNKLEAYLHLAANYGLCPDKSQAHFSVRISNQAPKSGLPAYVVGRYDLSPGEKYVVGSNLENVTIYLPIGAQVESLLVDGNSYGAGSYQDRGHQILVFDIPVDPGASRVIDVDWKPEKTNASGFKAARVLTSPLFNSPVTKVETSNCQQ